MTTSVGEVALVEQDDYVVVMQVVLDEFIPASCGERQSFEVDGLGSRIVCKIQHGAVLKEDCSEQQWVVNLSGESCRFSARDHSFLVSPIVDEGSAAPGESVGFQ